MFYHRSHDEIVNAYIVTILSAVASWVACYVSSKIDYRDFDDNESYVYFNDVQVMIPSIVGLFLPFFSIIFFSASVWGFALPKFQYNHTIALVNVVINNTADDVADNVTSDATSNNATAIYQDTHTLHTCYRNVALNEDGTIASQPDTTIWAKPIWVDGDKCDVNYEPFYGVDSLFDAMVALTTICCIYVLWVCSLYYYSRFSRKYLN